MERVDLPPGVWTLPAERSKNDVEHVVPLSAAALSILESIPRIGKRDGFVFTTTGETAVSGWSKAKATLDTASGIAGWRLHDIRRTGQRHGGAWRRPARGREVLNHVSGSFGGVAALSAIPRGRERDAVGQVGGARR